MSEATILIARKVAPASILEALPCRTEGNPFRLDIALVARFGHHWTGKATLSFLYEDKMLEQPLYEKLCALFSEGKIDRVIYRWKKRDASASGEWKLYGDWLRTVL